MFDCLIHLYYICLLVKLVLEPVKNFPVRSDFVVIAGTGDVYMKVQTVIVVYLNIVFNDCACDNET